MKGRKPSVTAVVGGQWGDEGKGKIVDYLASKADVVVRSQGGDNAGHTVVNDQGKFALHLIPAGIFNPDTLNVIGAGVALNPKTLLRELAELKDRRVSVNNLIISPKAHLAFDYHLYLDRRQEDLRGSRRIETTKRGVGPTYMDKAERIGLPVRLLLDPPRCLEALEHVLKLKRDQLGLADVPEFQAASYEDLIAEAKSILGDMITETAPILSRELAKGSSFVLEGAHGALLDLDHGTYPMVTASNSTVGGLLVGAGLPPLCLTKVVGVFKAYQTRVGAGGMPTELKNALGDRIREAGHEYGTTTGRPRRVGYFDGVAARYAHQINGFTDIAITRLDTLAGIDELKICHSYQHGQQRIDDFQVDDAVLQHCTANYEPDDVYSGWDGIGDASDCGSLPPEVSQYCAGVMKAFPGARFSYAGVGPERDSLLSAA